MTTTRDDDTPPSTITVPRWVLLGEEAELRGFRNALAFKRWCLKRSVPMKRDGRKLWVSPGDVDRAIAELPERTPESASDSGPQPPERDAR